MTRPDQQAEVHRLASAESIVDKIAPHVRHLTLISDLELRDWLAGLAIPQGWQIGKRESGVEASRIAVCGPRDDGGWDACETLSVYRFNGPAPVSTAVEYSDCTLRDLAADSITTYPLTAPLVDGIAAVRSTGYVNVAERRAWAQYSTYVRGERAPFDGLLIYQTLVVAADRRTQLRDDIAELGDAVHTAFLAGIATVDDICQCETADSEVLRDGP